MQIMFVFSKYICVGYNIILDDHDDLVCVSRKAAGLLKNSIQKNAASWCLGCGSDEIANQVTDVVRIGFDG